MPVRFIDPDMTKDVEVQGVAFTIGFWPPLKAERMGLTLGRLHKLGPVDLKTADPETAFAAIGLNREFCEDAVRYAVRSWKWDGAPAAEVKDGALSDKCVGALRLSGLLHELAAECMAFNTISEEEKKS